MIAFNIVNLFVSVVFKIKLKLDNSRRKCLVLSQISKFAPNSWDSLVIRFYLTKNEKQAILDNIKAYNSLQEKKELDATLNEIEHA